MFTNILMAAGALYLAFIVFVHICSAIQSRRDQKRYAAEHLAERAVADSLANSAREIDRFAADNEIRIISESLDIIRSTKNVDIAISRAEWIHDSALRLQQYHNRGIINAPDSYLKYARVAPLSDESFMRDLISRTCQNALIAANELKTEKGRLNRMKAYFSKLHEMRDSIPGSLYPYIDEKMLECGLDYSFDSMIGAEAKPAKTAASAAKTKPRSHLLSAIENGYIVFDLETTGLTPAADRIIEIGAIKFDFDGHETERFSTLINPDRPIPRDASAVNHITDDMVKNAPTAEAVLPDFIRFIGTLPLFAHNAGFDSAFLQNALKRCDMNVPDFVFFDTYAMSRRAFSIDSYKLGNIARHLGVRVSTAHRAIGDCETLAGVVRHLIDLEQ